MTAEAQASDAPAPSRLFTILGWACMLLSLYSLVQTAINHVEIGAARRRDDARMLPVHLSYGSWELLSVLTGVGGFGMWKRRSWAPNFASAIGGANLAQVGFWLVRGGPLLVSITRGMYRSNPMVAADLGFFLFSMILEFVVWLVALGAIFREHGRRNFPPSRPAFTTLGFCILAGAGMALSILMNAYFETMEKP